MAKPRPNSVFCYETAFAKPSKDTMVTKDDKTPKLKITIRPLIFPTMSTVRNWISKDDYSVDSQQDKRICYEPYELLSEIPDQYTLLDSSQIREYAATMEKLKDAATSLSSDGDVDTEIIPEEIKKEKIGNKIPGLMMLSRDTLAPRGNNADYFCIAWKWPGEYKLWGYEVSSLLGHKIWANELVYSLQFCKTKSCSTFLEKESIAVSSPVISTLEKLKEDPIAKMCYTLDTQESLYDSPEIRGKLETFFNVPRSDDIESKRRYIFQNGFPADRYFEVESVGKVTWELRETPPPLVVGETTDWITLYVSHSPKYGYTIEAECEEEPKLKFDGDPNWNCKFDRRYIDLHDFFFPFFILPVYSFDIRCRKCDAADGTQDLEAMKPFYVRFKVTAPTSLLCYGHYPYRITFKLTKVTDSSISSFFGSIRDIDDPPPVYLMVISGKNADGTKYENFDKLELSDTSDIKYEDTTSAGKDTFADSLTDPRCIPKYRQRQKDISNAEIKGGGLEHTAPPLKYLKPNEEMTTSASSGAVSGGDTGDQTGNIVIHKRFADPKVFNQYLKDYAKLKSIVCSQPKPPKLCGHKMVHDKTEQPKTENATPAPTEPPTFPDPEPLPWWSWQNMIAYSSVVIVILTILKEVGCFQKSLEQKILETQNAVMQPLIEAQKEANG